jgi:hypothetical protein
MTAALWRQHADCTAPRVKIRWLSAVVLSIAAAACGSSGPSSPSPLPSAGEHVLRGETVNVLDGSPMGRVTIKIGSQVTQSDDNGRFDMRNLREGSDTIVLSGNSVVERQRTITIPAEAGRETLIPASFDLAAFDEMMRGDGRLERWTTPPALVVLKKEMQFDNSVSDGVYHATSDRLSDADVSLLIAQLTEGLALLTGNGFTAFSSVSVENPSTGSRVSTLRTGSIVVGRYRGVQTLANTIGFGRWETAETSEVTGGAIFLDRNFDQTNEQRRLLRIHELGHALGYQHVKSRISIMNPAIGPEPSSFDRQAAAIAFQRTPGNRSPDNDVITSTQRPPSGGIFGVRSLGRIGWSAPTICGP